VDVWSLNQELLGDYLDSKHSRDCFSCQLLGSLTLTSCSSLAFRSSVVRDFLSDLDEYGGVDHVGTFSLFYMKVADIIALKLSRIFRGLLRIYLFPLC